MSYIYKLVSESPSNYPNILGLRYSTDQSAMVGKQVYYDKDLSRTYIFTEAGDDEEDYGCNLIVNPNFDTSQLWWGSDGGTNISDGKLNFITGDGEYLWNINSIGSLSRAELLTIGDKYRLIVNTILNNGDEYGFHGIDDSTIYDSSQEIDVIITATDVYFGVRPYQDDLDIDILDISISPLLVTEEDACVFEVFDVSDIKEAIMNLIVSAYCADGCSEDCSKNDFLLAVLLINGLESARVYHEYGDITNRDAVLVALRELISSASITEYTDTSKSYDLSDIQEEYSSKVYKYSLLDLYGIDCCGKTFKDLVNGGLIIEALDINNAKQYISESYVDCLVSKINKNNCNC